MDRQPGHLGRTAFSLYNVPEVRFGFLSVRCRSCPVPLLWETGLPAPEVAGGSAKRVGTAPV